jgi:hypothetical protein
MNHIYTAYFDLIAMAGLMNIKNNEKFFAVPVYPLARDICLMVYQINKEILNDSLKLDPTIKSIRHKVKLYQKKDNYKIYEGIVNQHIYQFGNDVDNLGFYSDENQLVGSTIYNTYVFQDTGFFSADPSQTREKGYNFFKMVGETIGITIDELIKQSNYTLPLVEVPSFTIKDNEPYITKDILSTKFFGEDLTKNIISTRLLLSLQEASTSIWLFNVILPSERFQINNYILLRLLTIKADEIMDNLKNIRKFSRVNFDEIDIKINYKLTNLITNYEKRLERECKELRNMIHYNSERENFFDFVANKLKADTNYINRLTNEVIKTLMEPINEMISNYLEVSRFESMKDYEKIARRLWSIVKRKNYRSL